MSLLDYFRSADTRALRISRICVWLAFGLLGSVSAGAINSQASVKAAHSLQSSQLTIGVESSRLGVAKTTSVWRQLCSGDGTNYDHIDAECSHHRFAFIDFTAVPLLRVPQNFYRPSIPRFTLAISRAPPIAQS